MGSFISGLYLGGITDLSHLAESLHETFIKKPDLVSREDNAVTVKYGDAKQVKSVVQNAREQYLKDDFDIEYSDDDTFLVMVFSRTAAAEMLMNFYKGVKNEA